MVIDTNMGQPQSMQNKLAVRPLPIRVHLVSRAPGRVRLRVSSPHRHNHKMESIACALNERLEIYRVRTNVQSGSITVFHTREYSSFENICAILQDLGIIFHDVTEGQSRAAAGVTQAAADLNQRVNRATRGAVDLRFLIPLSFSALALRQLLVKGLQLEIIPWYVLAWYAFDSFIKLHYTGESLSATQSERQSQTIVGSQRLN